MPACTLRDGHASTQGAKELLGERGTAILRPGRVSVKPSFGLALALAARVSSAAHARPGEPMTSRFRFVVDEEIHNRLLARALGGA